MFAGGEWSISLYRWNQNKMLSIAGLKIKEKNK